MIPCCLLEGITMDIDVIKQHFISIQDQRQSAKVDYPLFGLLFGTLCAVIAGARGWTDIREYLLGHQRWFRQYGLFEKSIPVDDTFARLIAAIEPHAFRECFLSWMRAVHQLTQGEVVAIDGKTLRGSYHWADRFSTIHMISAYASANQLVLGQLKTNDKSNEITAIQALIEMLELRGALVTIDTMACQTKIANTIIAQGGDYLLAVKGNQGSLAKALSLIDRRHWTRRTGRWNTITDGGNRAPAMSRVAGQLSAWVGLNSLVMVESFRAEKGKALTLEYRYYISSKALTPEQAAIRAHWGIEPMHWMLDVSLRGDACQIYRENAAENLAGLRYMALNMLRAEETKVSVPVKQKRCLMHPEFLERVLLAGFSALAD